MEVNFISSAESLKRKDRFPRKKGILPSDSLQIQDYTNSFLGL